MHDDARIKVLHSHHRVITLRSRHHKCTRWRGNGLRSGILPLKLWFDLVRGSSIWPSYSGVDTDAVRTRFIRFHLFDHERIFINVLHYRLRDGNSMPLAVFV